MTRGQKGDMGEERTEGVGDGESIMTKRMERHR